MPPLRMLFVIQSSKPLASKPLHAIIVKVPIEFAMHG